MTSKNDDEKCMLNLKLQSDEVHYAGSQYPQGNVCIPYNNEANITSKKCAIIYRKMCNKNNEASITSKKMCKMMM